MIYKFNVLKGNFLLLGQCILVVMLLLNKCCTVALSMLLLTACGTLFSRYNNYMTELSGYKMHLLLDIAAMSL
jgi:hypothetical protein